jgi:hypothetical protein
MNPDETTYAKLPTRIFFCQEQDAKVLLIANMCITVVHENVISFVIRSSDFLRYCISAYV